MIRSSCLLKVEPPVPPIRWVGCYYSDLRTAWGKYDNQNPTCVCNAKQCNSPFAIVAPSTEIKRSQSKNFFRLVRGHTMARNVIDVGLIPVKLKHPLPL